MKRIISMILALLIAHTVIPLTLFSASAETSSNLVYGSDNSITRAEWLHDLSIIFDMTIDEGSEPDNYFSDIDSTHKYYHDVVLNVEFGVINVEAGEKVYPDSKVTRDFAVSTLNHCLGYQANQNENYSFSDYAECSSPSSAAVALERGWMKLIDGKFLPKREIVKDEIKAMLDDASAILESAGAKADKNTYEFDDDVAVFPSDAEVEECENGVLKIKDTSVSVSANQRFAVFINDIPVVYTAESVQVADGITVIQTNGTADVTGFKKVDSGGTVDSSDMEFTAADDVELEVEEITTATRNGMRRAAGTKNIKKQVNLSKKLAGGLGKISVNMTDIKVDYSVSNSYAFVTLSAQTTISYGISVSAQSAFGLKSLTLFTCNIGGIGSFDVTAQLDFSGAATGTVKGYLVAGVECRKGDRIRAIQSFRQSEYYCNAEASAYAGLRVQLGVTKLPVVSAYVYAEAGAEAKLKATGYHDDKLPKQCVHFAAYLYARYGATASVSFMGWSTSASYSADIFKESNSPVRIVHHYEDGKEVASCSRGVDWTTGYFTRGRSRYGGCGWISANGAYGLGDDGEPFNLYDYTLDDDGNATITKYNGNSYSVYIPNEIDGHKVVKIGDNAFKNKRLSYVDIPDTVTEIEGYAFKDCSILKSVNIPDTVTKIGAGAFEDCRALVNVKLPKSLDYLDYCAFRNTAIESVEIPKSLVEARSHDWGIYQGPFAYCEKLKTVTFEKGTTKVMGDLFAGCTGLESIDIPDTVTEIEGYAFKDCSILKSVNIPDTVTKIGAGAFEDCRALVNVKLPKSLDYLDYCAFRNTAIESVEIPKSLVEARSHDWGIYQGPFAYCEKLKTVTFEKGTTKVMGDLFAGCTGLESIDIPDTVTEIEGYAFKDCSILKSVNIPDTVTKIGAGAFEDCRALVNVKLPKSLDYLDYCAFRNTAIESVEIPKSLVEARSHDWGIYQGPFAYCEKLKTVTFEKGTTKVVGDLFAGCTGLECIDIPDTVTEIKGYAFIDCSMLKTVNIPDTVTKIGERAFEDCTALTDINIPDSVTEIGNRTFANCKSLKEITFPNSVSQLEEYMFSGCESLEKVTLPNTIDRIQERVFYGCKSLKSISIPSGVKVIEPCAFTDCQSLTEIKLPENLEEIGGSAFSGCIALKKIEIPQSVKSMGGGAFRGCSELAELNISDYSITKILDETFMDCPSLKSVVLPKGLTTVGANAFRNDTALTKVTVPDSVTSINSTAFSYPTRTTICGSAGKYAETFAKEGGFSFSDINKPCEGLALADGAETVIMDVGEKRNLKFEYLPEDTTDIVTISGSNNNVRINGHTLTAVWEGDTVMTATTGSGISCEFNVHIRYPKEINIKTQPKKTTYVLGEKFDPDGMSVELLYRDGSKRDVDGYTISGFDSETEGEKTVTVTWKHLNGTKFSKTIKVKVVDTRPKLTGISVKTLPLKTEYQLREKLDLSGLVIEGMYTDGSTSVINDYTVSGYNALKAGTQTVTVKYGDFTTQFTVNVYQNKPDCKHIYVDTVTPATPTSKGYTTHKCSICGYQYVDSYTDYTEEKTAGLTISKTGGKIGDTVAVDISIQNNPGFAKMSFDLEYDDSTLELVSYNLGIGNAVCTISDKAGCTNKLNFRYLSNENVLGDGALVTLTFRIKPNAQKDTAEVSVSPVGTFSYYKDGVETVFEIEKNEENVEIIKELYGDVDGDGIINANDAIAILRYNAKVETLTDAQLTAANVDGNESVDSNDAILILKYDAKAIDKFPIG